MGITRKRLGALFGASALIAALMFMALAGFGGGTQTALAAKSIAVKPATLTNPGCEPGSPNEWHFVINQIDKASNAPASINVTWSDGTSTVVPLQKFTGGVAHYSAPAIGPSPTNATTTIYDGWKGQFNLSHGPCVRLNVSKTANTSFERKYAWTIDKSVDDDSLTIPAGQDSVTANYTVTVDVDGGTDSNFNVSGTISITNPGPIAAIITGVSDDLATPSCGVTFPYTLAVGASLQCTYSANLATGTDGINHATVSVTQAGATFKAEKAYDFDQPTTVTDECADVSDTNVVLDPSQLCVPISPKPYVYTYSKTFYRDDLQPCDTPFEFPNTAAVAATDTGAGDDDDVTVIVTAECEMHLAVSKTADTSFDRSFTWTIDKLVDQTSFIIPANGTSATANYTVSVTKSAATDSNFLVYGTVTITNDGPITATITAVNDDLAATDCAVPFDLAVGASVDCNYSLALNAPADGTNNVSVSVSQEAAGIGPFTASAGFAFGDPTNVIDDCVNVTDSYAGLLGNTCVSQSFYYSRTFTRGVEIVNCGQTYYFENIATFTAPSGATGSDSQTVDVTAVCNPVGGCSPGYWKNHLASWPVSTDTLFNDVIGGFGVPDGVTLLQVVSQPQVYGGPATEAVANYLSIQAGLGGYPPENCTLN